MIPRLKQTNKANSTANYESILEKILLESESHVLILKAIRNYQSEKLWIGGGIIRNLVWSLIHNIPFKIGDVDVFYYNKKNTAKSKDSEIEQYLKQSCPEMIWSVKNQARMHKNNSETQYSDLFDAIKKFPDTASAIICRLNDNNRLEIIAPYGLKDLFTLILRPTPHFRSSPLRMERYYQRVESKKWLKKWNKLQTQYDPSDQEEVPVCFSKYNGGAKPKDLTNNWRNHKKGNRGMYASSSFN